MSGGFGDMSLDDWEWIRSINLDGVLNGCHAFGPAMIAAGRGQIVNMSSGLGYLPRASEVAYCTTKAAVLMFSRSLRADWAQHGVGDRKSVVSGKSVSVRVDFGGRRIIKKKKKK